MNRHQHTAYRNLTLLNAATFDALHPEWAGRAWCPECEIAVGERHHADCSGYPRMVTEGVRR